MDSSCTGLPPSQRNSETRLKTLMPALGTRTALFAMASFAPVWVAASVAQTSSAAPTAGAPSSAAVAASPSPDQAARSNRKPKPIFRNSDSPAIATRPPVRREVSAKAAPKRDAAKAASGASVITPPANLPASATSAALGHGALRAQSADAVPATAHAPIASAPPTPPPGWSEEEIKQAKEQCDGVLRGVDALFIPEEPIKQGLCGSPAVFKLMSISKSPAVVLSPPVVMTCEMIASLDKWMKADVQPRARTHLGGVVVKIETMSSYSCRNAYGRARTKLSEHGKANAIDIGAFVTAKGSTSVLADWGMTIREQKMLTAKLEAERAAAAQAANQQGKQQGSQQATAQVGLPTPVPHSGRAIVVPNGIPGVIIPSPGGYRTPPQTGLGLSLAPTRLGGPKASEVPVLPTAPADVDPKRRFLHEIHTAACKYFGTVLGPEANNAHKNHFHLDMAPRRLSNFCE